MKLHLSIITRPSIPKEHRVTSFQNSPANLRRVFFFLVVIYSDIVNWVAVRKAEVEIHLSPGGKKKVESVESLALPGLSITCP